METLLPALAKVQEACKLLDTQSALELPLVAVVGAQSAGKSSVLDYVAGRDLFPVGGKGVTKAAVVVRMLPSEHVDDSFTFRGQTYPNAAAVRVAIESELRKSPTAPLEVAFESSRNPPATLVDLPGADIAQEEVLRFISQPSALILAVVPATEDDFDATALAVARKADPYLARTVVVVTKIDLLRREVDLLKKMQRHFAEVQLGCVAVLGRSQTDLMIKVSMAQQKRAEKNFFSKHLKVDGEQGIDRLLLLVNRYLQSHISKAVSRLRKDAGRRLQALQEQYRELHDESRESDSTLLYTLLMSYDKAVKQVFAGSEEAYDIRLKMHENLKDRLESESPLRSLSDEALITLIANSRGLYGSVFLPRLSLELLLDVEFPFLLQESLSCLSQICSEVRSVLYSCMHVGAIRHFPNLCVAIRRELDAFLDSGQSEASDYLADIVQVQQSYINLQHPNFIGDTAALERVIAAIDWQRPPGGRLVEARVLRTLVDSYSAVLRTLVCDQLPKVAVCCVIAPLQESVFERLAEKLLVKERFAELLEEVGEEKEKRLAMQKQISTLQQALSALALADSPLQ